MRRVPFVYVAHPIGKDPIGNARKAFSFADSIAHFCVPIVPDNPAWELAYPKTYEEWMKRDLDLVVGCDALFRMPGESPGADREVAYARDAGIPVFEDANLMRAWAAAFNSRPIEAR